MGHVHLVVYHFYSKQNLKILKFIGAERKSEWGHKFIQEGFEALEIVLAQTAGKYSVGDDITMADLCLIPQVYNAERYVNNSSSYGLYQKQLCNLRECEVWWSKIS